MTEQELFCELDLDGDGRLSRDDVHRAALHFGWQWPQASLFALLDLMTLRAPLEEDDFISHMVKIGNDPDGLYGEVLGLFSHAALAAGAIPDRPEEGFPVEPVVFRGDSGTDGFLAGLETCLNREAAGAYRSALEKLKASPLKVSACESALLVIDPQRSFTTGSWRQSLGPDGDREVLPIRAAFANCAALLRAVYRRADVMFTRCPFPPGSYDWDESLGDIIDPHQFYFIKPGNCVLLPETNGFREWVEGLIARGKRSLVMGGCTLNSCLRVSSLETLSAFRDKGLEVIVDLSLCGSRAGNYENSPQFGGISSVEAALAQMAGEGVKVAAGVEWV